jgi:hypothetical protein
MAAVEPDGATTVNTLIVCDGDRSENCKVIVPCWMLPGERLLKSGYTRTVVG